MFCHQGGGWLDLAGRHRVSPGSLVQIPGWMVHRVRFQSDARYTVLMFDASRFPSQWTLPLESQRLAPAVTTLPRAERWFERWQDQPEELLPRLASQLTASQLPQSVRNSLTLAHEAAVHGWGAGEIAHRLGYSLPHLTTQVARYTGRSLGQWVQEARLDLAAMLLASGPTTVAKVAERCGYADLSHFRRAFKKKTGQAPSQFQSEVNHERI
jgi:AraC-like DNA-binding protein